MNFDIYDMAVKVHVNMNIFIKEIVNTPNIHNISQMFAAIN